MIVGMFANPPSCVAISVSLFFLERYVESAHLFSAKPPVRTHAKGKHTCPHSGRRGCAGDFTGRITHSVCLERRTAGKESGWQLGNFFIRRGGTNSDNQYFAGRFREPCHKRELLSFDQRRRSFHRLLFEPRSNRTE